VSELAAGATVTALPDITGQTAAKPVLPAGSETALKVKVRELAEKLTRANVNETRDALLALV